MTTPDTASLSSLSHAGSNHSTKSLQSHNKNLVATPLGTPNDLISKTERIRTTLLRDQGKGLGFSIAGGRGAEPFIDGCESVFISKIADEGPAIKDGKLQVGDKIVEINGTDVEHADHLVVVEILTGLERFVNLVVERKVQVPLSSVTNSSSNNLFSQSSLSSLINAPGEKSSPKVFGLPKPYAGLYSSSSYMANRPSYMRTREPGQYTITSTTSSPGSASSTPSYTKLPGISGVPGMNLSGEQRKSFGTLPGSKTLPEIPKSDNKTVSLPRTSLDGDNQRSLVKPQSHPDAVRDLISRLPDPPTGLGVATETVKRTTYSETTVKRVTNNQALVVEVRQGLHFLMSNVKLCFLIFHRMLS